MHSMTESAAQAQPGTGPSMPPQGHPTKPALKSTAPTTAEQERAQYESGQTEEWIGGGTAEVHRIEVEIDVLTVAIDFNTEAIRQLHLRRQALVAGLQTFNDVPLQAGALS